MTPSLLVGDDTGLIKLIRRKDSVILKKFGTQALGRGITYMAVAYPSVHKTESSNEQSTPSSSTSQIPSHLITAHSDCTISVFDWATNELVGSHKSELPITGLIVLPADTLTFENQSDVDPALNQSIILTCTSKGQLKAQPLYTLLTPPKSEPSTEQSTDQSMIDQPVLTWSLDGPISCIASNPFILTQIAAAGRENLLRVFDLTKGETIWRAKNVKHDKLNLRPAVDPTCVAFVDANRLVEGTATRCMRFYDTKLKRMALCNVVTGEHVITCCAASGNVAFIGDGGSNLSVYDLRTHMRIGGYKGGCQGSVRGLAVNQSENLLASASMDRYVRVFDITKRTLVQKVYLKQKLNCCMFVNDIADPTTVKQEDEQTVKSEENVEHNEEGVDDDVDDDELWGELERRRVNSSKPVDVVKVETDSLKVEMEDDDSDVEDLSIKQEEHLDSDSDVQEDDDHESTIQPSTNQSHQNNKQPTRQSIKQSTKSAALAAATAKRKGFVFGRRKRAD